MIALTILLFVCRPRCPECGSKDIDEHMDHGICRLCGKKFDWNDRFGRRGGADL
jgi:hypothetical protein